MKKDKIYENEIWKANSENQFWKWKITDKTCEKNQFRTTSSVIETWILKHVLKTVRNIEIQNEKFSDNCEICTCAQKMKVQSHEAVKSVSELAKRLHIDFWRSYWQEDIKKSWYILMMTDDCIKHEWIFIIKNWSFEILIEILKFLIKQIKHESD